VVLAINTPGLMTQMFVNELKQFARPHGGLYENALKNIISDMHGPSNPRGNITQQAQRSLDSKCASSGGTSPVDVKLVISEHYSYHSASGAPARSKPQETLRRVVPYSFYVVFHLKGAIDTTSLLGNVVAAETTDVPLAGLRGWTSDPQSASWWTWGAPPPGSGEEYVKQLALPQFNIGEASESGGVAEISIPHEAFKDPLYKPSALDGFMKNSPFAPDLTDTPHGWSKPDDPTAHPPRPELVSRAFAYAELRGSAASIRVATIPY
jgi:hypothetical protein